MRREPYVVCIGLATRDTIYAVPRVPGADGRVVASALAIAGGGRRRRPRDRPAPEGAIRSKR